jgi:ADP-ribosylglycohydrolase
MWAAYGDVLGFPTELASPSMVKQRLGSARSQQSSAWRRLVGGRFGAQVDLCIGAYSDDTQLRLATSRSIGSDGFFDVESFAKIELPVWLSYSLGAGRGSKAAASALCDQSYNWFSNFYSSNGIEYVNGGGNGAAMRIQPHVWSAPNLADEKSILASVVRNAISTHGHIRGIAGAMVHAVALARVLRHETIPGPDEWMDFADVIRTLPELVSSDGELVTFWLPTWEKLSGVDIAKATESVAIEWLTCVAETQKIPLVEPRSAYYEIVKDQGGLTESERGSGLKSAFFSLVACWLFRGNEAKDCIDAVANYLQSDTDTIATMAGALFGALPNQGIPNDTIQDSEYLQIEAVRLFEISLKNSSLEHFTYPDLLYWQPPKIALDCVGFSEDSYKLAGFGRLTPLSEEFPAAQKGTVWQWFQLGFGQTILCKRRLSARRLPILGAKAPSPKPTIESETASPMQPPKPHMGPDLFTSPISSLRDLALENRKPEQTTIDQMTAEVIRSNFDAKIIGDCILKICQGENAIELAIGFSAIVVKARTARMRKGS